MIEMIWLIILYLSSKQQEKQSSKFKIIALQWAIQYGYRPINEHIEKNFDEAILFLSQKRIVILDKGFLRLSSRWATRMLPLDHIYKANIPEEFHDDQVADFISSVPVHLLKNEYQGAFLNLRSSSLSKFDEGVLFSNWRAFFCGLEAYIPHTSDEIRKEIEMGFIANQIELANISQGLLSGKISDGEALNIITARMSRICSHVQKKALRVEAALLQSLH